MIKDDEFLERIVAGIQAVTSAGADVKWNERINGRQFDVVVRFRLGTLSYLVLVEVRNKTRKAEADDLDAFATKAGDQNANKAVFVNVAGYQAGAIAVAKRHGIDIFTLTFEEGSLHLPEHMTGLLITNGRAPNAVPHFGLGEENIINNIERVSIEYEGGDLSDIPDEPSQMTYYCRNSRFANGRSIDELIAEIELPVLRLGQSGMVRKVIEPAQELLPADEFSFPSGRVVALALSYKVRKGRPIIGNTQIDPGVFVGTVVYRNEITGEATRHSLGSLPFGDRTVLVGHFYCTINPMAYFFCDANLGQKIRWHMVESFQSGRLLQATVIQAGPLSGNFIRVRDKKTIKRLQKRLDKFLEKSANVPRSSQP